MPRGYGMKARFFTLLAVLAVGLGVLSSCSDAIYADDRDGKEGHHQHAAPAHVHFRHRDHHSGEHVLRRRRGSLPGSPLRAEWNRQVERQASMTTRAPFNPPGTPLCNAMALFGGTCGAGSLRRAATLLCRSPTRPSPSPLDTAPRSRMPTAGEQVTLLQSAGTFLFLGGATAQPGADYVFQLDTSTRQPRLDAQVLPR